MNHWKPKTVLTNLQPQRSPAARTDQRNNNRQVRYFERRASNAPSFDVLLTPPK